jgi:hypothetical protein
MEYTKEQIDALIADAVKTATKGMYTEDELSRRVTSEVDRRVETGIQKGLDTYKNKWQKEFEDSANLSAEQLAQKKLDEKLGLISQREKEVSLKANQLLAKDLLHSASIPKEQYEKFLDVLVLDDEARTAEKVGAFVDAFNFTKSEMETEFKSKYSTIPKPDQGGSDTITKEKFTKMGYAERLQLKNEKPELYQTLIK